MRCVPVLRSGVLAQDFCARIAQARVEAVFARSLYLRAGDSFLCIGGPDIGCGPITLTADQGPPKLPHTPLMPAKAGIQLFGRRTGSPLPRGRAEDRAASARPENAPSPLSGLDLRPGMSASVCDQDITIENAVRFTLDCSEPWCALPWPACPPPKRLIEISATLARRAAIEAPEESLARHFDRPPAALFARVAGPRITLFENSLYGAGLAEAAHGLIGLGPGLTPSGDDFLSGALAALQATGERAAHARLSDVIAAALGSTSALSACFLQAVASGHVGEHLHRVVASAITGDVEAALTAAAAIGHSSGWDMLAGVTSTLRTAAAPRYAPAA
jgi:hypothetical protein